MSEQIMIKVENVFDYETNTLLRVLKTRGQYCLNSPFKWTFNINYDLDGEVASILFAPHIGYKNHIPVERAIYDYDFEKRKRYLRKDTDEDYENRSTTS